jgi:repressor LexA
VTAPVVPLLTVRQRRILEFIREFYAANGFAPTLREIAVGVGLGSPSTVLYQLGELQRMGWVRRHPGLPRALVVLNPADGREP